MTSLNYCAAGVNIAAGAALAQQIRPLARATARAGVLGGISGVGALSDLGAAGFAAPVLVATAEG